MLGVRPAREELPSSCHLMFLPWLLLGIKDTAKEEVTAMAKEQGKQVRHPRVVRRDHRKGVAQLGRETTRDRLAVLVTQPQSP